jgi:hypothetical protein
MSGFIKIGIAFSSLQKRNWSLILAPENSDSFHISPHAVEKPLPSVHGGLYDLPY